MVIAVATKIVGHVVRSQIEIAALVDRRRHRLTLLRTVSQEEELNLGVGVEGETEVSRLTQRTPQHVAGIRRCRRAVGGEDVAEHPGGAGRLSAPRQDLEGRRVGLGEHVCLMNPGEAFNGGSVETDPLIEGALELGRRHGH